MAGAVLGVFGCTGNNAYVTTTSGTVVPINTATNTAGSPISVGSNPQGIATDWLGINLWVANCASNTVTQLEPGSATVALPSGSYPQGIAVTSSGKIYVANSGYFGCVGSSSTSGTVTPIIPVGTTYNLGSPISGFSGPLGMAATPDGKRVYVTNATSSGVSIIDTKTNAVSSVGEVYCLPQEGGVAVSPDSKTVYVATACDVQVINNTATPTIGPTINTGGPTAATLNLTFTPDGKRVYATTQGYTVVVIDPTATPPQLISTISDRSFISPFGIMVTPDGKWVYVTNQDNNTVSVIDTATNKVTTTIPITGTPNYITMPSGIPPPL